MVLQSLVILLLLAVTSRADSENNLKQEGLKPARYTLVHLSNGHLAYKVTEENSGELPNWQDDSTSREFDMLKSELETKSLQNCLNLLNHKLTSPSTNLQLETRLQLENNLDLKLCIQQENWNQSMLKAGLSSLKTRRDYFYDFERTIDPVSKKPNDCIFHSRQRVRPCPGECYWPSIYPTRSHEFWGFWNEVGPDLLYLYDFVLKDSVFQERRENQLWYLIAYLRVLVFNLDTSTVINQVKEDKESKIMKERDLQALIVGVDGLLLALVAQKVTITGIPNIIPKIPCVG